MGIVARVAVLVFLLLAALALMACAGSDETPPDEASQAFDDVRASIQSVVKDPQRAARATELVNELEQNLRDVADQIRARRAAFLELSADYDAPRAELEELAGRMLAAMRSNRQTISDANHRLLDTLTDEEWDALDNQHSEALAKAVAALRQS